MANPPTVLRRLAACLLAASGSLLLTGCGGADDAGMDDMLTAGQAQAGGQTASHCAAPAPTWADAGITHRILSALAADPALRAWPIAVDTIDGKVVLHGRVPSGPLRERATRLALAVPGVTLVDSLLDIHG